MKILSRFKDYYDFAAGYDTDPRKVYNRVPIVVDTNVYYHDDPLRYEILSNFRHGTAKRGKYYLGLVLFCNNYYNYLYDTETRKYYYRDEDIPLQVRKEYNSLSPYFNPKIHHGIERYKIIENHKIDPELKKWPGAPVIYSHLKEDGNQEVLLNGRLEDIKFGIVKPPQEAYQELYNWIEFKEPETDNEPNNMNRFESKGFDKKTSFRNIK